MNRATKMPEVSALVAPAIRYGLFFAIGFSAADLLAQEARFWLSPCDTPPGSEIPIDSNGVPWIAQPVGATNRTLHIWGQSTPGQVLESFSLNIVSSNPDIIEFVGGENLITVYNEEVENTGNPMQTRYQWVHDWTTGLDPDFSGDRITGMLGATLSGLGDSATGLNPDHCADDAQCFLDQVGIPAWLIASVTYDVVSLDADQTEIFLQIGQVGMNHAGGSFAETDVIFGDAMDLPSLNAGCLPGEPCLGRGDNSQDPDAIIEVLDSDDELIWASGGDGDWSDNSWLPGGGPPGNGDQASILDATVSVTDNHSADETIVGNPFGCDIGRLHLTSAEELGTQFGGELTSSVTIEASGIVSGGGTVVGTVTNLDGVLSPGGDAGDMNNLVVPEPTSCVMTVVAILGLCGGVRRVDDRCRGFSIHGRDV